MITGFKIKIPNPSIFNERIKKAQKFLDSEILRKCDPYIPFKTGMLRDSGILGTKVGSGRIRWIAPYAKRQYYKGRSSGKRGRWWLKRAMTAHGVEIIRATQKKLNGG